MARDARTVVLDALKRRVEDVVRALVINVTAELRESTPVDTGWARANWIPSTGVPYGAVVGTREAVTVGAQEAALASVVLYRWGMGAAYITNNVPYIGRLNDGSSRQAPAGFVQISVARAARMTSAAFGVRIGR